MSLEAVQTAITAISDHIPLTGAVVTMVGGAVEMALRLIKSDKPLSLAYGIASVFHGVGALFEKLGDLLDKILPQRTNPTDPPKA